MSALASRNTIQRKSDQDGQLPQAPAAVMRSAKAPSVGAAAQIHRSMKAWRDEAKEAPAPEAAPDTGADKDEKADGGDKGKPAAAGGDEKGAAQGAAFDASADKGEAKDAGGGDAAAGGGEAKADADAGRGGEAAASDSSAAAGAESEEKQEEEATPVAAKLNRKVHRAPGADPKEAQKKEKRDKLTVLRELVKKEFEACAVEAEKRKGEIDTLISIGQDALNILTMGLAAPVQAAVSGGVAAVRGSVDMAIAMKADAVRQMMNHAVDNMSVEQLEALAKQLEGKEQTVQQQQKLLQDSLSAKSSEIEKAAADEEKKGSGGAGAAALGAATGANDGKGSRALSAGLKTAGAASIGWNTAKAFMGKASAVIPALGTIVSVGKLAWNARKASKIQDEIKQLRDELKALGDAAA